MRKLMWGGAAAGLLAVGFVGYRWLPLRPAVESSMNGVQEEQEPTAPAALAPARAPLVAHVAVEVSEPIVVEGPANEPLQAPQLGGEALPGAPVAALGAEQPPRPDEEPGEEKKMPYAEDAQPGLVFAVQLWEALCRVLNGEVSAEAPPAGEEQAAPELPRLVPPVRNYHQNEMHCPYTGRCVSPAYPVPPPAAPLPK